MPSFYPPVKRRLIPAHAGKTFGARSWMGISTAHPRSRGENALMRLLKSRRCGSSPLTRGKPASDRGHGTPARLIPAHAGKTPHGTTRGTPRPAHPRSRGENIVPRGRSARAGGSSPLTRGKLQTGPCAPWAWRLIPAHAGKTSWREAPRRSGPAHPRSRGENRAADLDPSAPRGSSPLTRGKPRGEVDAAVAERLIPAHAGKTFNFVELST